MKKMRDILLNFTDSDLKKRHLEVIGNTGYKIFRCILLFAMCFIIIHPVLYMISVAFRDTADLYDPTVIWVPKHFVTENFKLVIETLDYWKLLINTLEIALVGTIFNVSSCALAGYSFARFRFRLREPLFLLVLFMIIIPPQVVSIPLYLQYSSFDFFGISIMIEKLTGLSTYVNFLDTKMALYIPAILGCGLRSGFLIYMFRQFFRNMPAALEDAAYIDGCGTFKTFFKIIIPNASGSFLVASILSFVWYYNDYFFTTMYFNKVPTLSVGLSVLKSALSMATEADTRADPYTIVTQMQAGCLLVIVPLIIAFFILQRRFIKSIESSGIVG